MWSAIRGIRFIKASSLVFPKSNNLYLGIMDGKEKTLSIGIFGILLIFSTLCFFIEVISFCMILFIYFSPLDTEKLLKSVREF